MPDNAISPKIYDKITAFCSDISVAYNLDEEIQAELRGHFEDKVLAYLNGDETLTEQDAYLLVREHFGNTETVKNLLKAVHIEKQANPFINKAVLHSLYALAIGFLGSLVASHHLIEFVMKEAIGSGSDIENYGQMGLMKLKIYSAFIIFAIFVFPYVLYSILLSLHPGVTKYNEKSILIHAFCSSVLFGSGLVLAYYYFVPHMLAFSVSQSVGFSVYYFTSHILSVSILFGVILLLPALYNFILSNGIVNHTLLVKYHKYVIVSIFILSAFTTPPDPASQLILAVPLYVLYEFGFRIVQFMQRRAVTEIS